MNIKEDDCVSAVAPVMESETAAEAAPEEAEGNGAVSHATMEMIEGPGSGADEFIDVEPEPDGEVDLDGGTEPGDFEVEDGEPEAE
jgi:hypothetical protein